MDEATPDTAVDGQRARPKVLIPPVSSGSPTAQQGGRAKRRDTPRPSGQGGAPSPAPVDVPAPAPRAVRTRVSRPGVARVFLTHLDPWSVMKQGFLLSLALAIIILVASATLWFALDSAGVFEALTRTATDVGGESGANVGNMLSFSKVMGVSLVLAGIETVLVTALVTLFAFLYNLAVGIGGGLELTLSEEG